MPLKTFEEQLRSHLEFLHNCQLDVETLDFCEDGVRCHAIGEDYSGRGEYWYKSQMNTMRNGRTGIVTSARGMEGELYKHSTYGKPPTGEEDVATTPPRRSAEVTPAQQKNVLEKARYLFEEQCVECITAPYLDRKNIKAYGIRLRETSEHGKAVVVPARDVSGTILSCQYLNEDGSKMWMTHGEVIGAFHALATLTDAEIIAIGEGYATCATCMEVFEGLSIKIAVVAAFAGWNLKNVAITMRKAYPNAKILILADNDRHLSPNIGLEHAISAFKEVGGTSYYLEPCFGEKPPLKTLSDWNDLARECGVGEVRTQLLRFLREECLL